MSDNQPPNNDTDNQANENVGDVGGTPLFIHKQYLKDLSFENPNAPGIFSQIEKRPKMDMNIGIDVVKLAHETHEHYFEVILKLTASAAQNNTAMFLSDVAYGAAVSIHGVEEKHHHPMLFVEVPQLIFPFARHILATVSNAGAYMPLQLAPVDFRSMYMQRFGKKGEGKNNDNQDAPEIESAR